MPETSQATAENLYQNWGFEAINLIADIFAIRELFKQKIQSASAKDAANLREMRKGNTTHTVENDRFTKTTRIPTPLGLLFPLSETQSISLNPEGLSVITSRQRHTLGLIPWSRKITTTENISTEETPRIKELLSAFKESLMKAATKYGIDLSNLTEAVLIDPLYIPGTSPAITVEENTALSTYYKDDRRSPIYDVLTGICPITELREGNIQREIIDILLIMAHVHQDTVSATLEGTAHELSVEITTDEDDKPHITLSHCQKPTKGKGIKKNKLDLTDAAPIFNNHKPGKTRAQAPAPIQNRLTESGHFKYNNAQKGTIFHFLSDFHKRLEQVTGITTQVLREGFQSRP